MSQTIITAGQSLVDVAIQELGSVEALFELADAAGLAITDALAPGALLLVPASPYALPDTAGYFRARAQRINTGDEVAASPLSLHDFDFPAFDNSDFDTN